MATTIVRVPVQIAADMTATNWPPHPTTGAAPSVNPSDHEDADESVVVFSRTNDDDAVAEWMSMGAGGRDERYIVDVVITTQVPGRTWGQMMERLAQLLDVALASFTNDAGQFVPPGGVDDLGDNEFGIWTGMANAERLNQYVTDQGWAGQGLVAVRIAARV